MSVRAIEAEVSIKSGVSADVTIGREVIRTVYVDPVLESLSVTENGVYEPAEGVDGYSDVTVNVPGKIPVLEQLNAIVNGEYYPEEGVDGFNEVLVNVPNAPEKMVASGSFIATAKSTGAVIDTKNTDWTKLIIVPHVLPHPVANPRSIGVKYIDMSYGETGMCLSQFASNSGATFNAGGWHDVNIEDDYVTVEDGVVTFITGGNQASVGLFIKDVQYDWYAWNENALEPEETNIFEGEFEATEDGVLTIDTGYTGEGLPKMLIITTADGYMNADFLSRSQSAQKRYAIAALSAYKKNSNAPVYDSEDADSALNSWWMYISSSNTYALNSGTCYYYKTDEPDKGNQNLIKIADSRHIKIFTATGRGGSSTSSYFVTGEKYRYQIFY